MKEIDFPLNWEINVHKKELEFDGKEYIDKNGQGHRLQAENIYRAKRGIRYSTNGQ